LASFQATIQTALQLSSREQKSLPNRNQLREVLSGDLPEVIPGDAAEDGISRQSKKGYGQHEETSRTRGRSGEVTSLGKTIE